MRIAGSRCRIDGDLARVDRGLTIVLLHGFGAPGDDLVGLAGPLREAAGGALEDATFVFPEAPIDLGPELHGGRAWWWVDLASRDRGPRGDGYVWETRAPEGLDSARARIDALLDELARLGVAPERTVLGGFSQGAMLSLDVALRRPRPLAGVVVMSGALIARDEWSARASAVRDVPIFQSHGQLDDVLPFASAEALQAILAGAGARVVFRPFAGGHTIPEDVLAAVGHFLAELGRTNP